MSDPNSDGQWNDCRAGELHGMVRQLRHQERRQTIRKALAASAVAVLLIGVAVVYTGNPFGSALPGGIACRDVHTAMADYVAQNVNPQLKQQIDAHLAECEACQEVHRQEQRKSAHSPATMGIAMSLSSPTSALSWLIATALTS